MSTDTAEHYLVAHDPEAGYCRLFRTDSVDSTCLVPLWTGFGLRAGYDAMIRLNRERKPTDLFHVCSRPGARGRTVFKVFKGPPREEGWRDEGTEVAYAAARKLLTELVARRDASAKAERDRILRGLRRAGVATDSVPRLSGADMRYIRWLESTGRLAA